MASPKKPTRQAPSAPKRQAPAKKLAPGIPFIDTQNAAAAAAAWIGNRSARTAKSTPAKESFEFKQLKESLHNPSVQAIDNLLDQTDHSSSKKSNAPYTPAGQQQVGHNQTFGADVNRANVPRRTAG
jgi:hypothetical protein